MENNFRPYDQPDDDNAQTRLPQQPPQFSPLSEGSEDATRLPSGQQNRSPLPNLEDKTRLPSHLQNSRDTSQDTQLPTYTSEPLGYLFIQDPYRRRGSYHMVKHGYSIGRGDSNNIVLPNGYVSERHANIKVVTNEETEEHVFTIFDYDTPNGTYVNGIRIEGRTPLQENDEIRIGEYLFVFKILL